MTDPIAMLSAQARYETAAFDDPRSFAAWALVALPAPNKRAGEVPLVPTVTYDLSEILWHFGFRHHPDLQTQWQIPGDHPEAGYLNVPKRVDRAGYDEWLAANADPDAAAADWTDTAMKLLGELNPKLAQSIQAVQAGSESEIEKAREAMAKQVPAAFERLAEMRRLADAAQQAQADGKEEGES